MGQRNTLVSERTSPVLSTNVSAYYLDNSHYLYLLYEYFKNISQLTDDYKNKLFSVACHICL